MNKKTNIIRPLIYSVIGESGYISPGMVKLDLKGREFISINSKFYKNAPEGEGFIQIDRIGPGIGEFEVKNYEEIHLQCHRDPQIERNGEIDILTVPLHERGSNKSYVGKLNLEEYGYYDDPLDIIDEIEESREILKTAQRENQYLPQPTQKIEYFFDKNLNIGASKDMFPKTWNIRRELKDDLRVGKFDRIPLYLESLEIERNRNERLLRKHVRLLEKIVKQTEDWNY